MKAKLSSWCALCNSPIEPGQEIVREYVNHGSSWVHIGCPEKVAAIGDVDDDGLDDMRWDGQ